MAADRKAGTKPMKSERTHEENQERAYIAASRRSDRSLEARVESARRASEIHKKRTGKALRITEKDVMNEEMYEEEDDEIPQIPFRNTLAFYPTFPADTRLHDFLQYKLMVQQVMGQVDPKTPLTGSEKYQFTNPQLYNPYALGAAMFTPLPYQNMHRAQQFLSSPSPTLKSPVQHHLMNRFHPYAKPNPMQNRQFSPIQTPVLDPRNQTPVGQLSPRVTQSPRASLSPESQPAASPQNVQLQSPVSSHSSNQSPASQAQTPPLTNSSAGSTPTPTIAESSSLATSPILQNDRSNMDNFPLSSAFTPDVQSFFSPTMSSMFHSNEYNTTNLDFLKSVGTLSSTHADHPQFNFNDVFDTSVFNATAHLTNTKVCGELPETSSGSCHYPDITFDSNCFFEKPSQSHSITDDLLSREVSPEHLKTTAPANDSIDLFSDPWTSHESNSWLTDESFWNPLPDIEGWTNVVGLPSTTGTRTSSGRN